MGPILVAFGFTLYSDAHNGIVRPGHSCCCWHIAGRALTRASFVLHAPPLQRRLVRISRATAIQLVRVIMPQPRTREICVTRATQKTPCKFLSSLCSCMPPPPTRLDVVGIIMHASYALACADVDILRFVLSKLHLTRAALPSARARLCYISNSHSSKCPISPCN